MTIKRLREQMDETYKKAAPPGWPMSVHPMSCSTGLCAFCRGSGLRLDRKFTMCGCVYRRIFVDTLAKYHRLEDATPKVTMRAGRNGILHSRPREEFRADVLILAKRATAHDKVLRFVFGQLLIGAEWGEGVKAAEKASLHRKVDNRGRWFHEVYETKELVGRAWACGQPYGVYPFDQYFSERSMGLNQFGRAKITRFPLPKEGRLDLPDRMIPDVRAERIARDEKETVELRRAA
jgi:hypothetical protein